MNSSTLLDILAPSLTTMRSEASVLHLDLDAFYASVEQRDKPSLRGKPVVVGGIGGRGVVATASYEARKFKVHSAQPVAEARRLAPHAAYLSGRRAAYRQSSKIVMALLRELSPRVEPLSLDEAFVDLRAGGLDTSLAELEKLVIWLRAELKERTEGLNASVGVGTSKLMAKLGSEAAKPNGYQIYAPGSELEVISPMPVQAIPGVGPATTARLNRLGIRLVSDLQHASLKELSRELGEAAGSSLHWLAFGEDERPVTPSREAKSISTEDTFEIDVKDSSQLDEILKADAKAVAGRLVKNGLFAKTITLKARLADFTTYTRSRTIEGATDRADRIHGIVKELLAGIDIGDGLRLIGVGVSNFTQSAQEELFYSALSDSAAMSQHVEVSRQRRFGGFGWRPGNDVVHDEYGRGWVWGCGKGIVTLRFETRLTGVGPVRSLRDDDPKLHPADPLPMTWDMEEDDA